MSQTTDDDLGWGPSPVAPRSSFTEPELVTDMTPHADHAHDDHANEDGVPADGQPHDNNHPLDDEHTGEVVAKSQSPNYPVLAVFGLIAALTVGGVGWWANKQFFNKPVNSRMEESMVVTTAPAKLNTQAAPDAVETEGKDVALASVFGESLAAAPQQAVTAASGPAKPASGAIAFVPPKSTLVVAPGTAAVVVVPAAPAYASAVVAPAAPAAVVVVAAAAPKPKPESVAAVVKTPKQNQGVLKKSASRQTRVARSQTVKHRFLAKRSKTMTAKVAPPREEFVLPRGLSVRSIYPISGPNAQAWIADSAGRVEIVRIGDTLRSGSQVLGISGEKGQVQTASGVITTRAETR